MENPKQRVGVHNGCCTGLMQIHYFNLRKPEICGCTPDEYGTYTQDEQIDVYVNYFRTFNNNFGMNHLKSMIDSNQTLGGHIVDGYTLVACAQMGTGNCDAAVRNACSSTKIGEGGDTHVNVCTMADDVRSRALRSPAVLASCP